MSAPEAAASAPPAAPAERETLYTAVVTATDGRHGRVASADGRLVADLSYPRAMGGDDGPGTNPEQLFAAGFAACFHSALKGAGRQEGIRLNGSTVTASVALEGAIPDGLQLAVELTVAFPSNVTPTDAARLAATASARCPYSKAMRELTPVTVRMVVDAPIGEPSP